MPVPTTRRREDTVLAIVKSDSTFEQRDVRGERLWVGRCFHCGASLVAGLRGETFGATIEHIVPRGQGGTEELMNLALACARCNQRKGASLDARPAADARVLDVQAAMLQRRRARFRT